MVRSSFERFVTDVRLWGNLKAMGLQISIGTTRYIIALVSKMLAILSDSLQAHSTLGINAKCSALPHNAQPRWSFRMAEPDDRGNHKSELSNTPLLQEHQAHFHASS
jgi:hypothetical protein